MSMRNDANDDFDVPSLRADSLDDDYPPTVRTRVHSRPAPVVKVKSASTGPLWALVGALFFAFAGLAWWSFQQISLMEQQLVATQESFARISEEAAGRLQDISGKVVASQTNVTSDSEALKLQIKVLESKLLDQGKQQEGVVGQASDLDKRLAQMTAQTSELDKRLAQLTAQDTEHQAANTQLQAQVKALSAELTALKSAPDDSSKIRRSAQESGRRHCLAEKTRQPKRRYRASGGRDNCAQKRAGQPSGRCARFHQYRRVRCVSRPGHPQHQHSSGADPEFAATTSRTAVERATPLL